MRRLAAALALVTIVAPAAQGLAQDDEAQWNAGVQLRAEGRDAEALAHFQRMHAQSRSPRTLAQIALAEQALGRWGAAALHLDQARGRPDAWVSERANVLGAARAEIAPRVGDLEVRVEGAPADVEVDGLTVGRSPLPGPVPATAGTVTIRLLRDGRAIAERAVTVQAGALTRESIRAPGAASGGGGSALGPVGWTMTVLGGLALVGMGVAWGLREDYAGTYNDDPRCAVPGMPRAATCMSEYDAALTAEAAAIGLGVAGGAVFVTGLILALVDAGGSSEQASLACAPAGAGLACRGSF